MLANHSGAILKKALTEDVDVFNTIKANPQYKYIVTIDSPYKNSSYPQYTRYNLRVYVFSNSSFYVDSLDTMRLSTKLGNYYGEFASFIWVFDSTGKIENGNPSLNKYKDGDLSNFINSLSVLSVDRNVTISVIAKDGAGNGTNKYLLADFDYLLLNNIPLTNEQGEVLVEPTQPPFFKALVEFITPQNGYESNMKKVNVLSKVRINKQVEDLVFDSNKLSYVILNNQQVISGLDLIIKNRQEYDYATEYQEFLNFDITIPLGNNAISLSYVYEGKVIGTANILVIQLSETPEPEPIETESGQAQTGIDVEGGTGDRTSDEISKPVNGIAGNTYTSSSYILNYNCIRQFKRFLYDSDFLASLDIFNSSKPQSAVIGCQLFPFDLETEGGWTVRGKIRVGTYDLELDGETVYQVDDTYKKSLPVGEYKLLPYFGSFLDYSPYTQISINLPYAGKFDIDPSLITNKTLKVYYEVDIVSGEGRAILEAEGIEIGNYKCMLGTQLFFSSSDKNVNLQGIASGLISTGIAGLSGGPAAMGMAAAYTAGSTIDSLDNPRTFNTSSSVSSALDRMLSQDIYLTITRPETAVPKHYNKLYGRPSQITLKLSDCKGFTSCDKPMISIKGTDKEREMIETLLKEGVVIK